MSWGCWLKAWLKAWSRLLQADFFTSILVLFAPNGVDLFVSTFLEEKGKKCRVWKTLLSYCLYISVELVVLF